MQNDLTQSKAVNFLQKIMFAVGAMVKAFAKGSRLSLFFLSAVRWASCKAV